MSYKKRIPDNVAVDYWIRLAPGWTVLNKANATATGAFILIGQLMADSRCTAIEAHLERKGKTVGLFEYERASGGVWVDSL